jgi:hypothetical protein
MFRHRQIQKVGRKRDSACHNRREFYSWVPSLRIAREHVTLEDAAIEIGASYGRCTSILAKATGSASHVLGVETSKEVVAKASEAYPTLHFEQMDVFKERLRLLELTEQVVRGNARVAIARTAPSATELGRPSDLSDSAVSGILRDLVVFVDIGGNRELETLVALIPWVQSEMRPRLLVVKSEVRLLEGLHETDGRDSCACARGCGWLQRCVKGSTRSHWDGFYVRPGGRRCTPLPERRCSTRTDGYSPGLHTRGAVTRFLSVIHLGRQQRESLGLGEVYRTLA